MAVAMIGPKFYAWDRNGKPLAFGKLYTYQARTNTPKATYQSEDQIVENTNPVILNGEGYANVYLDGSYKMVLKDSNDNEIWSSDPVSANQAEEWVNCFSATYVSSTSFKISGNQTDKYDVGRGVRINNNAPSFEYSIVESSVYAGGETSVVISDPVVTTGLIGVCASIVGPNSGLDSSLRNDLSADSGATLIGTSSGLNVQEEIDEIKKKTPSKNFCWAGNFDVWQRGVSFNSFTSRKAVADGWTFARSSFDQGATVSQQGGSLGINNSIRVQRDSGDSSLSTMSLVFNLGQSDSVPLAGEKVTLSFRARKGDGFSSTDNLMTVQIKETDSLNEQSITSTSGAYSSGDNTAAGATFELQDEWQDFELTADINSLSRQVAVRFTYAPTGIAPAADYYQIELVQIEISEQKTEYVFPDPTFAVMKAEEQYYKTYDELVSEGSVNYLGSIAVVSIGDEVTADFSFPVRFNRRMRASPTVTAYSPQTGDSGKCAQGSTQDVTVAISQIGTQGCTVINSGQTPNPRKLHYVHIVAEAIL